MNLRIYISLLGVLVIGCGGGSADLADVVSDNDTAVVENSVAEISATELPGTTDTASELAPEDAPAPEIAPECEAGQGCLLEACETHDDCFDGWCVLYLGEMVCTQTCDGICPDFWACEAVDADGKVGQICVPPFATLCLPCEETSDCDAIGADAMCLDFGPLEGSFCGSACSSDGGCPTGYTCAEATSVDEEEVTRCIPDSGTCECGEYAAAASLSTTCEIENEFGICEGMRSCSEGTLSDCDAVVPAEDLCDGLDNDCDGDTDTVSCDDSNPCTIDSCEGADGCVHTPDDADCDDDDECTDNACIGGKCVVTKVRNCGGDCGVCEGDGAFCDAGVCQCDPLNCVQLDHACGDWPDGCGSTIQCGTCTKFPNSACVAGQCDCEADSCEGLSYDCGKQDDGCGGTLSCGSCDEFDNSTCVLGKCKCVKFTCDVLGKDCSTWDDGCDGEIDCGGCTAFTNSFCDEGGLCQCTPESCESLGKECGEWDDNCGGTVVCDPCEAFVNSFCNEEGACDCVDTTCDELAVTCGEWDNNCGGLAECGLCEEFPNSTCQEGTCGCVPDTCESLGNNCGEWSDGCGATIQCGTCTEFANSICQEGTCGCVAETCESLDYECDGWDNGCGGTVECGGCELYSNSFCDAGTCGCVPETCDTLGVTCGEWDNNCGNSVVCGGCDDFANSFCNDDGACDCTPENCDSLEKECGSWDDGCGENAECGGCEEFANSFCDDEGACDCAPDTCDDINYECGEGDDGCGVSLECGTCDDENTCTVDACEEGACTFTSECLGVPVINEIDYEQPGADNSEFIELYNPSDSPVDLTMYKLQLVNGANASIYKTYQLGAAANQLPAGAYLVIADPAVIDILPEGTLSMVLAESAVQNENEGLRIVTTDDDSFVDGVHYEGTMEGVGEGGSAGNDSGAESLSRCPNGSDTNDNSVDFFDTEPSPGVTNSCL